MKAIESQCLQEIGIDLKVSLHAGSKAALKKISEGLKSKNNYIAQRLVKKHGVKITNAETTCYRVSLIIDEILKGMK